MPNSDENSARDAFARLIAVITELREKCPWDREQKLADTPRHLLEEAYELADAIERGHPAEIADELGDLIAQGIFLGVILAEQSQIDVAAVMKHATDKLMRRHPHVYGETRAETVDEVLHNWEQIKLGEREKSGADRATSLEHTGRALPAMMRAEKLGEKARRAGMDWANLREVLAKVREEIDEVEQALDRDDEANAAEEIGDMMLALANAPRFLGRNAEQTLRAACEKFVSRFDEVTRIASERNLDLKAMTPGEIEALWQQAKGSVRGQR